MKFLTLNTHSWLEIHQHHKIHILADFIVEQEIDVIALQEVNQNLTASQVTAATSFIPASDIPLKSNNFALLLMEIISQKTGDYTWSWGDSHQGWEIYDEGLAIISRIPLRAVHNLEISEKRFAYTDVFRRCALACQLEVQGKTLWVVSAHMNWWLKQDFYLFEHDFASLDQQIRALAAGAPVLLLGDFNNDAAIESEGYRQILEAGWHDAFTAAEVKDGEFTVHHKISGWEDSTRNMRIDYIFTSTKVAVQRYTVVFPDNTDQAISDHSGIVVEIDPHELTR
ncbi:endonuclease/exonuclease/phosphatase family protein [uncultured Rothia sp.]|uniref:endonuclease/exonuclease/phosphatase family protein n=1 Tax=uncultured Rothia sp. TaxID=316088 RepID=UPI00321738B1